jgi:hypothetical protein
MPGRPFIGSEVEQGGRALERNGRSRWCAIMAMKVAVLEGDRAGSDEGVCAPAVTGGGSAHTSQRRGRGEQAGRRPRPRRMGRKPELGPIKEIKLFLILFEIQIFGKL